MNPVCHEQLKIVLFKYSGYHAPWIVISEVALSISCKSSDVSSTVSATPSGNTLAVYSALRYLHKIRLIGR